VIITTGPRFRPTRNLPSGARQGLLCLLGLNLCQLPFPTLLAGIETSLGVQAVVPPPEAGCVVPNELLVVKIVVVSASPERDEAAQAPRKVIAAVRVDGLEESQDDPSKHGHQVEVTHNRNPDDGCADNAEAEEHSLNRGRVLGGEAEWCAVGVVKLMNVLVERTVMQCSVEPVMPGIFEDEEA